MAARVFIDGEAGTTGLGIRARLDAMPDVELVSVDPARRKNPDARREAMAAADLAVLCLPDEAAREAVVLAGSVGTDAPKLIDASSAHRVAPGWVYGFPELTAGQSAAIAGATRVSNPGCYPTGAVALLRPLVDAGLLPPGHPVSVNAVSGYSGGGKAMIEAYDAGTAPAFELYGLALAHKHLPELRTHAGLTAEPIFVPSVGAFRQGMLVSIPLHLASLPGNLTPADLEAALDAHYGATPSVRVRRVAADRPVKLDPEALNDTDGMELFVFGSADGKRAVLVARLDNLGKGASGAAVANLRLMLGLGRVIG